MPRRHLAMQQGQQPVRGQDHPPHRQLCASCEVTHKSENGLSTISEEETERKHEQKESINESGRPIHFVATGLRTVGTRREWTLISCVYGTTYCNTYIREQYDSSTRVHTRVRVAYVQYWYQYTCTYTQAVDTCFAILFLVLEDRSRRFSRPAALHAMHGLPGYSIVNSMVATKNIK